MVKIHQNQPPPPRSPIRRPPRRPRLAQSNDAEHVEDTEQSRLADFQRDVAEQVAKSEHRVNERERQQNNTFSQQQRKDELGKPGQKLESATRDGFESQAALSPKAEELRRASEVDKSADLELQAAIAAAEALAGQLPKPPGNDPVAALNDSQAPGTFYREHGDEEDEVVDPELLAAVEEIRQKYGQLPGIVRVSPAINEKKVPIIVIRTGRGITERIVHSIPQQVRQFEVVVSIPYSLLPLKKDRDLT